jgi:hypothetical protein
LGTEAAGFFIIEEGRLSLFFASLLSALLSGFLFCCHLAYHLLFLKSVNNKNPRLRRQKRGKFFSPSEFLISI